MTTNNFTLQNGVITQEPIDITTTNRSFKYGDGLFETIKITQGYPLYYLTHYSRFVRGLLALQIDVPETFTIQYFYDALIRLIEANQCFTGVLRLQAYRNGAGKYTPIDTEFTWLGETTAQPKTDDFYDFQRNEYKLGVYKDVRKDFSSISFAKTNNALPYILAGDFAKEKDFDNVLLLNTKNEVVEAIAQNIFIYKNGVVYTPPIESGAIEGVCRAIVKKIIIWNKIEFKEKPLTIEDIQQAEEVFLTNTLQGILPVTHFMEHTYSNNFTEGLFHKLNERVGIILAKR